MADNKGLQAHSQSLAGVPALLKTVLSDDLEAHHLMFQLAPSRSHILWNVGHLAWAFDRVVVPAVGLESQLDDSYVEKFGMGSQPVTEIAAYPAVEDLTETVANIVGAVIAKLGSLNDGDLDTALPDSSPVKELFPTLGALLGAAVFHAGYHTGQIALLRRAQGLPSGMGM